MNISYSANPPKSKKYLARVVCEYSDGTARYIDEEDLKTWLELNTIIANTGIIGLPWNKIKWRTIDGTPCKY